MNMFVYLCSPQKLRTICVCVCVYSSPCWLCQLALKYRWKGTDTALADGFWWTGTGEINESCKQNDNENKNPTQRERKTSVQLSLTASD